jgi:hypothetical protein
VLAAHAEPFLVALVGEAVAQAGVDVGDQGRHVVGDGAQPLFAFDQAGARDGQFGDVLHRHHRAHRFAAGAVHRAAAGQQVADAAVRGAYAHGAAADAFAAQGAHQRNVGFAQRRHAIRGVQAVVLLPAGAGDVAGVETVELARGAVEQGQLARAVAGDHRHLDRFQHRIQQFLLLQQFLFGGGALAHLVFQHLVLVMQLAGSFEHALLELGIQFAQRGLGRIARGHHHAPVQLVLHHLRQVAQHAPLGHAEFARARVEDAQGADRMPIQAVQRLAGIETHARFAAHIREIPEALVGQGVAYDQHIVQGNRVAAHRDVA